MTGNRLIPGPTNPVCQRHRVSECPPPPWQHSSLVLLVAALVTWLSTPPSVAPGAVLAIALGASSWTIWAIWTWLGARRRITAGADDSANSVAISQSNVAATPMECAIIEHLEWSINDLRSRFCEIQQQRLDILLPRIGRGEVDRDAALAAEIEELNQNSAELLPVLRTELIKVAAPWCEGTLASEKAAGEYSTDIMDGIAFIRVSTLSTLSRRLPIAPLAQ